MAEPATRLPARATVAAPQAKRRPALYADYLAGEPVPAKPRFENLRWLAIELLRLVLVAAVVGMIAADLWLGFTR